MRTLLTVKWSPEFRTACLLVLVVLSGAGGCGHSGADVGDDYTRTIRARALLENGHPDAALRILRACDHTTALSLCNLGLAQQAHGEPDDAAGSWRKALERDPDDVRSLYHLAAWELERGLDRKPHEATGLVQHALARLEQARMFEPRNAAILRLLSEAHARLDETARADSILQEAERLDPGRAGRVPEAFGFNRIVLPPFERAPSVTRHAPRYHAQALEAQARGLVDVAQSSPRHATGLVLLGTRAWLRNRATHAPENIQWAAQSLLERAILGGAGAPLDADARSDMILWSRPASTRNDDVRTEVWFATWSHDSLVAQPIMQLDWDILAMRPLDVDGDGDIDLVIGASEEPGIRVWRNDGRGGFRKDEEAAWFAPAVPMHGLHAADLNDDRILDLVSIDGDGGVHLWVGRHHGSFADVTRQAGLADLRVRTLALADLDADGRADLLLGDDEALWIHVNRGSLHFERNAAYRDARSEWSGEQERGVPVASIQVADFDNDGKLDVLTQHFKDPEARLVAAQGGRGSQGRGGGSVVEDTAPSARTTLLQVPDKLRLALWRNEGHGILTDVTVRSGLDAQWTQAFAPIVADLDQDGDLDLATVGPDNRVHLLWSRNEGMNRRVVFDWGSADQVRRAHGARVEAYAGRRVLQTRSAEGALSLGIGTLEAIDVLRIHWADGRVQNVLDLGGLRLADGASQRLVLQVQP